VKLKEIATIRTGLVLSRKKALLNAEFKKSYKQITLKSFSTTTSLISNYLDEFISNENIKDTYLSKAGDIVVRLREPNIAVYIDKSEEEMIIPSLMVIIRVTHKDINNEYLAHYLNSTIVKKALQIQIKGTTIPMIKTKDLEDIEIILPTLKKQKILVNLFKTSQNELKLLTQLKEEKENFVHGVFNTIINQTKEDNKNAKN